MHKEHYCQLRSTAKSVVSVGADELSSPEERIFPTGAAALSVAGAVTSTADAAPPSAPVIGSDPMTILVLPTHPPIVVPLCILQSARLLTADQPMPAHSVIVSGRGEIQFRTESPEEISRSKAAVEQAAAAAASAAEQSEPALESRGSTPRGREEEEEALDLSSKASDATQDEAHETSAKREATASGAPASGAPLTGGSLRIRQELAAMQTSPALPFLPPKVFAELEALGMCLGVPSGHDMSSNPAQWLAMLENAVIQASGGGVGGGGLLAGAASVSSILSRLQSQEVPNRRSNAICCEECNITFRRMESYVVHKQHYCAARHKDSADGVPTPAQVGKLFIEKKNKSAANL